jgi:hypothetical protein
MIEPLNKKNMHVLDVEMKKKITKTIAVHVRMKFTTPAPNVGVMIMV